MPTVLPVKFAYAARELWFDENGSQAQEGDHVICSTERGTEIGLACAAPREMSRAEVAHTVGNAVLKPVLRVADEYDLERADELARQGDEALPVFRRLINDGDLDMKPVGVEYLFGGEKVVCYFSAEERVDFRQLVRDLGHELHERIDMRQIGVREESAIVGGYGHCGQELCCARFGLSFEPVSIRMAKEQDLPLTSNKISGACGRLMCCLRYEFEAYRDFKGRAPKRSDVIDTPLGKAKVVEYDTPKERIALRLESGKIVRIPLAEMETSDDAKKRAEERHCACRPDTVVRESLERLNSPDVQMALAELDRKMGVVVDEPFEDIDIFVESKPKKRRSRAKGTAAPQQQQQQQQAQQAAAQESSKRTRRRRRRSAAGTEDVAAAPATEARAPEKAPQAGAAHAPAAAGETRRRRHHKTAAGEGVPASTAAATSASKQPAGERRTRRRPGDRAGQQAQQKGQPQGQKAPQQKSQPKHMKGQPQPQNRQQGQDKAVQDGQGTEATKRRRRRRRKSAGGTSAPNAGAGNGSPQQEG